MAAQRGRFSMSHPVIITFLILAIIAFMYFAAEVLKPLALAVLLSFALAPLSRLLERRGLPRTPSVVLTVVVSLGLLGGVGYVVWNQLSGLVNRVGETDDQGRSRFAQNIERKLKFFQPKDESATQKLKGVVDQVTSHLEAPPSPSGRPGGVAGLQPVKPVAVEVVSRPTQQERLEQSIGPVLEPVAVGFFVLILVLFILMGRDDLSDRLVSLFGRSRVSLTTRTMDEIAQRIGRYLLMFATVNSTFGLIVGLGLWAIGIKYAVLWGFLAAAFRFIPYAGPAAAFALPALFSVAEYPGWRETLMVLALFGVMEVLANSFLEPVIYGKTTGISALGLLVAAMFWTWLWGALGLLLSTPLTVCLAVLGKYVPSLGAFATLLGEESELPADVRLYQRLLGSDSDGATELIEEALRKQPRAEVFDKMLIPALSRAERDFARDEIDDRDQAFVRRVIGDVVADQEGVPDLCLASLASQANGPAAPAGPPAKVVAVATNDASDALVLRMLEQLMAPAGVALELLTDTESPLKLADAIAERSPGLVVLSHLPPVGLTSTRYLVRRLRARLPGLTIVVGRWGEGGDTDGVAEKLVAAGASRVVFSLADARDRLVEAVAPKAEAPALAVPAVAAAAKA